MNCARSKCGVAISGDKIYAIGGEGLEQPLMNTVERYDPGQGIWEPIPPMTSFRRSFGEHSSERQPCHD